MFDSSELLKRGLGDKLHEKELKFLELVSSNHIQLIRSYLEANNIDLNFKDGAFLKKAVAIGNIDIVKYLINKGADINSGGESSVLLSALLGKNDNITNFLLDNGAKITKSSFLHCDDLKMLSKMLFTSKANKNDESLIGLATIFNQKNKVNFLLKNGFKFSNKTLGDALEVSDEIFKDLLAQTSSVSPDVFIKLNVVKHKMILDLLFNEDKVDGKEMLKSALGSEDFPLIKYLIEEKKVDYDKYTNKSFIDVMDNGDLQEYLSNLFNKEEGDKKIKTVKKVVEMVKKNAPKSNS